MDKKDVLESILNAFISGATPEGDILALSEALAPDDTTWMMEMIESLHGPHDFMTELNELDDGDNAKSAVITEGFFKFIDLVSGLIILKGEPAYRIAEQFKNSNSHYVPWVLKFCSDQRFQGDIKKHFPFLGL